MSVIVVDDSVVPTRYRADCYDFPSSYWTWSRERAELHLRLHRALCHTTAPVDWASVFEPDA